MLENKTIKVRSSKNLKKINIYFAVTTLLIFVISAALVPDLIRYLATEDDAVSIVLSFAMLWKRGLAGLAGGIIFTLYGIKKFDPALRISLIRFFLITFILLVVMFYLSTR